MREGVDQFDQTLTKYVLLIDLWVCFVSFIFALRIAARLGTNKIVTVAIALAIIPLAIVIAALSVFILDVIINPAIITPVIKTSIGALKFYLQKGMEFTLGVPFSIAGFIWARFRKKKPLVSTMPSFDNLKPRD